MAFAATVVWEVRQAGNAANGGGFDPTSGTPGTDYSQQNAAQVAYTDLVIDAVTNTNCTSVATAFTSAHVGNVINITSGTGFTVQRVQIMSVAAGVATCDKSLGTLGSTGGVGNLGGAVAKLGDIATLPVAGNLVCVKADGTYAIGTTNETFSAAGSSTAPIRICGYNATRPTVSTHGDTYQGRTNGNGALITTNFPVYDYSTGSLTISGNYVILEGIKFTGEKNGTLVTTSGNYDRTVRCIFAIASAGALGEALRTTGADTAIDCDVTMTNGGGIGFAALRATNDVRIFGCRVTSSSDGIYIASTAVIAHNTVFKCGGIGINLTDTNNGKLVVNNTVAGCTSDGIRCASTTIGDVNFINNCVTDNGGYGFNFQTTAGSVVLLGNRTRDNTSGAHNLGTNWVAATNYSPVTTDTGGATTDYTNVGAGTEDYTLISTSPAAYAAFPLYNSMGALQRNASAGGAGGSYTFIG